MDRYRRASSNILSVPANFVGFLGNYKIVVKLKKQTTNSRNNPSKCKTKAHRLVTKAPHSDTHDCVEVPQHGSLAENREPTGCRYLYIQPETQKKNMAWRFG